MNILENHLFDILVIGSGAAGLTFALNIADRHTVAVICKGEPGSGATLYAQGGIAAVMDDTDSIQSHVEDTIIAGAGLCDEKAVTHTAVNGKKAIEWLQQIGADFTRDPANSSALHLTREGGHSARRIVHSADATGAEVQTSLIDKAKAHPNITLFQNRVAVDLIVGEKFNLPYSGCVGAYVYDTISERVEVFSAHKTVLATGGAKNVYLYTTSPGVSSGDGIAMAWRAGCRVANMEFNQFHPTCLYHPHSTNFLITEALRGEGAHLTSLDGKRFMSAYDNRGELAPRDIVARAIDAEMKLHGADCVYLDISHKPADFVKTHFPNIYNHLLSVGIDITRDPIPVVPAAHYTCGGAMTNLNGQTDVKNLYAIGEVAYTGLHGANRMASNSLLECLVFAISAAEHVSRSPFNETQPAEVPAWDESRVTDSDEEVVVSHNWQELRRFMWDYVGIVRTTKRLNRARTRANMLAKEIDEYYGNFKITADLIELRHLLTVSKLIIESALARKESRGLHYTLDYPTPKTRFANIPTVLTPDNYLDSVNW